jgi:oxalate decarboxylase family bicupin protein
MVAANHLRFLPLSILLTPAFGVPLPQGGNGAAPGPPGASGYIRGPLALGGFYAGEPTATTLPATVPTSDFTLAPGQSENANLGLYIDLTQAENPQPIRGGTNAPTDPGPRNMAYDRINSDLFIPPSSDAGDVPNAVWPFGLSHNRHGTPPSAGWARQQNVDELPLATAMAGVDMRLEPNSYRELHWHKEAEWSFILNGTLRVSAVNEEGQSFVDDLQAGDVWYFPAGIPHSIQAKEDGCEFLLVFDDGSFSEDNTFLVSELFERNPQEVLAKNFRTDVSSFANLPSGQLYIFPGTPAPTNISEQNVTGPAGVLPQDQSYTYHLSQVDPYTVPGGSIKIIDSVNFPIAQNISAALFVVEPGAMRELHWHTKSDEWAYFIAGTGRLTAFDAPQSSRTFDFHPGDVGYVPVPDAHYVENTGSDPLVYLEVMRTNIYNDISVNQWLGLTPPQVVEDHLKLPQSVIANLPKTKPYIVPGNPNMTTTNFTGNPEK